VAEPTHARIWWLLEGAEQEPETLELKKVRKKSMFVFTDHAPSAGTEARFELVDADGAVLEHGRMRVVFQRQDTAGCEFLERHEGPGEEEAGVDDGRERIPSITEFAAVRPDDQGAAETREPSEVEAAEDEEEGRERIPSITEFAVVPPEAADDASEEDDETEHEGDESEGRERIPSITEFAVVRPEAAEHDAEHDEHDEDGEGRGRIPSITEFAVVRPEDEGSVVDTDEDDALPSTPPSAIDSDAVARQPLDPDSGDALPIPELPEETPHEIALPAASDPPPAAPGDETHPAIDISVAPVGEGLPSLADEEEEVTSEWHSSGVPDEVFEEDAPTARFTRDELPDLADADSEPTGEWTPRSAPGPEPLESEPTGQWKPQPDPDPLDSEPTGRWKDPRAEPEPEPPRRDPSSPATLPPPGPSEPSIIVDEEYLSGPRAARLATRIRGKGATKGAAIGIDLGTSNTCASVVENGRPRVIPMRTGTNTVPSVLTIRDGKIVVGEAAAKRMVLYPHETIYGSKRLIGRKYTDQVASEFQGYFAYPLVEGEDHGFAGGLASAIVPFEDVAMHILAEVKACAVQNLGQPIDRAVITVPAYFGEGQRDAVRRAARAADLPLSRIVNEPTAAAVAYGYDRNEDATLVVFDLGGGTFDVSVLKVKDNRFEVVATGGDAFMGGIDVDDMIANRLLEEFNRSERVQLEPDAVQLARLREAAEECKHGLSVQNRYSVYLPQFAVIDETPRELRASLSRGELDALAADLVARMLEVTREVLAKKELAPEAVDDVLLVGGMTRMPLVQEKVEELFGRRPSKRINPDEAVALGAALLSARTGGVQLIDVLPLSIGFAGEGRRFMRLISRNTAVPTARSFAIPTVETNQREFPIPIFQGEIQDAARNEYLGTVVIRDIPPGPAGQEIELTLALDEQCMLEVTARHPASERELPVLLEREMSAAAVIASLGPYTGPPVSLRPPPRKTALGRFFGKLTSLFRR